jgi:hypothetical protein
VAVGCRNAVHDSTSQQVAGGMKVEGQDGCSNRTDFDLVTTGDAGSDPATK